MLRMISDVNREIVPLLEVYEPQYTADGYAVDITNAFTNLSKRYEEIDTLASSISNDFVNDANVQNKARFYNSLKRAVGVDMSAIINNEDLTDILVLANRNNVSLIKSIPSQYFKQIETIVYTNLEQGSGASSMISQIRALNGSTYKRARVIARDQTSKLNSALIRQRQLNIGVEEYVWRTAGDGRVRKSHIFNNGKTFRWDDPPEETGHPGEDTQCRCTAEAIIKI